MTVHYSDWAECDCEFAKNEDFPDDPQPSYHFLRICKHCGGSWYGLHCPHDGYQNPCGQCGRTPTPEPG